MTVGSTRLTYNGELWNYRELRDELRGLGRAFDTTGDTEVIATALDEWGVGALPKFEGMFAVAWTNDDGVLRLARDRFGEVPVHFCSKPFAFASELKTLRMLGASVVDMVGPGEVITVAPGGGLERARWYEPATGDLGETDRGRASATVRKLLETSVDERGISDVPVCTLLSGGIDSAAVAALLVKRFPDLVGYVAVLDEKSPDLKAARMVAEYLGIRLVEVKVPVPSAEDLAGTVRAIEMPFKAQVEIGWACLVLADAVSSDGFKVAFSGEGSDELWASYGFAYHGVEKYGWFEYRKRLFLDQHRKNFARVNKVFMAHGVEGRLPFLNTALVEYALGLSRSIVADKGKPKAVLQDAFQDLLPKKIIDRQKLAFQDGMGLKKAITEVIHDPKRFYRAEFSRF